MILATSTDPVSLAIAWCVLITGCTLLGAGIGYVIFDISRKRDR